MAIILKNLAKSTLATGVISSDTTAAILTGTGALFPVLGAGDYFYAAMQNAAGVIELIKVTARSADTLTIVRAQGGTTALSWAAGDVFAQRMTVETFQDYIQQQLQTARSIQSVSGSNTIIGAISGLALYTTQAQYSFIAAANNTGATTINISGIGARNILSGGLPLVGNELVAGIVYLLIDNGTYLSLINSSLGTGGGGSSQLQYAVTTGTAAAYEAAPMTPITAYSDNQVFKLNFDKLNADNATIRVSGVNPPLNLKIATSKGTRVNVAAGDIIANHVTLGLVVDGGTNMLIEPATNAVTRVGFIEKFSGVNAPFGFLSCPLIPANISRVTYADLFTALVTNAGYTIQTLTSISNATPAVFTKTAHGFFGSELIRLSTTGTLPAGLLTTQDYYVTIVDANTYKVSSSLANYLAGTFVATTTAGTGTHSWLQSLWGLGDGTTTFGIPYFPANYADVQASANIGTITVGQNLSHAHGLVDGSQVQSTVNGANYGSTAAGGSNTTIAPSGGPANLAAGVRLQYCVCYRD